MLFIGDVHGKIKQYEEVLLKNIPASSREMSIQVGDMGVGFQGVNLATSLPQNHWFIRGNHDSPSACALHPNYLGEFGFLSKYRLFYLGGAWSVDSIYREPYVSWWPNEELSEDQLKTAFSLYCQWKPYCVVTHEAPSMIARHMLFDTLPLISPKPTKEELDADYATGVRVYHGPEYENYKSEIGFKKTRTSRILQEMYEAHPPRYWIFGHYHNTCELDWQRTTFICLGELATKRIPDDTLTDKPTRCNPTGE